MTIFTVLEAPDGKPDKVAIIPDGFSWGAFLFSALWALWHRLWVAAMVLFALGALLTVASALDWIDAATASLLQLGIALLFGFEARNIHLLALERSGYRRVGIIQASSRDAAELTYFAARAPGEGKPTPSRYPAPHDDTLGIFGNV